MRLQCSPGPRLRSKYLKDCNLFPNRQVAFTFLVSLMKTPKDKGNRNRRTFYIKKHILHVLRLQEFESDFEVCSFSVFVCGSGVSFVSSEKRRPEEWIFETYCLGIYQAREGGSDETDTML